MITFKKGKQTAGTVVLDANGIAWKVLKDIVNAQAEPREGVYYTRHHTKGGGILERLEAVEAWIAKQGGVIVTPEKPVIIPEPPVTGQPVLKDMFGINAYPWNFTQDPKHQDITDRIFEPKMEMIKTFKGGVRHYIDRELIEEHKGVYTLNPTHRGSWHFDLIFERCHKDGLLNLVCLKEAQKYLYEQWPEPSDSRHIPASFGINLETAAAYIDTAKQAFQVAARYGSNSKAPRDLVTVNSKPRWTADPVNEVKIGLGTVKYMEADNERDIWWAYKMAQSTARMYAAQCSAFYDGHKGTLGADVGVKTADPSMVVVMGGLATPSVDYVREMVQWCRENRGLRADGSVDLCWDVINYHQYSNNGQDSGQWGYATRGVAPELRSLEKYAREFVALGKELNQPVWVTETGYDVFPTPQSSNAIGNKSAEEVHADWIMRTALLYARCGIERVFFYQLFDDNPASPVQYSSSGMAVCTMNETRKRPAALLIDKFTAEIGDYSYLETISTEPMVDVYNKDGQYAYVCFIADEKGREMDYTLKKKDGTTKTFKVTETPVIIK